MTRRFYLAGVICIVSSFALVSCKSNEEARVQFQFRRSLGSSAKSQTASTSVFESDHCYFLNISSEESPVCASGASSRISQLVGPVPKGGVLDVTTAVGMTRFDLLSFPKAGDCAGAFAINDLGGGKFTATLAGTTYEPVWLVGSQLHNVISGPQTVMMDVLGPSNLEMGVPLACDDSKKPVVSNITLSGTDTLVITGTNLNETSRVSLPDWNTTFSIVSKSATILTAKLVSSANVALGSVGTLLVSNAYGTTTATLTVQVGPASVQPSALDLSQDWPFPTPRVVSLENGATRNGSTTPLNLINMVDGNTSTYGSISFEQGTMYGGTCDGSSTSTDGGYFAFQLGDGTVLFNGQVDILYSTVGYPYVSVSSASSESNMTSETVGPVFNLTGNATPTWASALYSGTHLIIRGTCGMSAGESIKIYEIRALGRPL